MTKMITTAMMTKRKTMAIRTAMMGSSLIGLLLVRSVVVAASCFSAG
jgi:hypothetical protein